MVMKMMKVLELKDICGYLPYELAFKSKKTENLLNCYSMSKIFGYDFKVIKTESQCFAYNYDLSEFIPVLRPISDLYKTITHNGKEIVPIVELAKIATRLDFTPRENKSAIFSDGVYTNQYFGFSKTGSFFRLIDVNDGYDSTENIAVDNQYKLFDYLHELKIDYRGLIESGLAINANTLETNPYK
jgi:hypothetical protein